MEYPEIGNSHVDPEMHDSTGEDDTLLSLFRRTNVDRAFYYDLLSAVVNNDLSTLNLPAKVEARLSDMLTLREYDGRSRRGKIRSSTYLCRGQDDALIAELRREGRKEAAENFRRKYSYGRSMDQKTLVWPGGTYPWTDNSSGITWVGVHGMDSICVVARAGDLDVTRVHRDLKYGTIQKVLCKFRSTVISEIEDLESPSSKLREIFGQSIPKPFSVVSVVLGTYNTHNESCHEASSDEEEDKDDEEDEVSSDENESMEHKRARYKKYFRKKEMSRLRCLPKVAGYDEKKTIKFLREQLKRNTTLTMNEATKVNGINASSTDYDETSAINFLLEKMKMRIETFTVDETIKTAISAFQHLFQKKFKASEIEVSVMDPNYFITKKEAKLPNHKDIYVNHLEMSDIEDHLAAINGGPTITFVTSVDTEEHLGVINGPVNGGCLSVGSGSGGSSSD